MCCPRSEGAAKSDVRPKWTCLLAKSGRLGFLSTASFICVFSVSCLGDTELAGQPQVLLRRSDNLWPGAVPCCHDRRCNCCTWHHFCCVHVSASHACAAHRQCDMLSWCQPLRTPRLDELAGASIMTPIFSFFLAWTLLELAVSVSAAVQLRVA